MGSLWVFCVVLVKRAMVRKKNTDLGLICDSNLSEELHPDSKRSSWQSFWRKCVLNRRYLWFYQLFLWCCCTILSGSAIVDKSSRLNMNLLHYKYQSAISTVVWVSIRDTVVSLKQYSVKFLFLIDMNMLTVSRARCCSVRGRKLYIYIKKTFLADKLNRIQPISTLNLCKNKFRRLNNCNDKH